MNTNRIAFEVNGTIYSLDQMLEANADVDYVCEWLRSAKPGDKFEEFHCETVVCVAV